MGFIMIRICMSAAYWLWVELKLWRMLAMRSIYAVKKSGPKRIFVERHVQ